MTLKEITNTVFLAAAIGMLISITLSIIRIHLDVEKMRIMKEHEFVKKMNEDNL